MWIFNFHSGALLVLWYTSWTTGVWVWPMWIYLWGFVGWMWTWLASICGVVLGASVCRWSAVWSMWSVTVRSMAITPLCGIGALWVTPVMMVIIPMLWSRMASIGVMMTAAVVSVKSWLRPWIAYPVPVLIAVSGTWSGMVASMQSGLVMLCWSSHRRDLMWATIAMWLYSSYSKHLMLGQFLAMWPCSWHWKHLSLWFDIMLTIDGGVMVAVSCCTALSFSTLDMLSLRACSPFSYMWVAKLWAFFKPLMNILIVATSLVKLHLLASVLNWCTYAARHFLSCCWIYMKHNM